MTTQPTPAAPERVWLCEDGYGGWSLVDGEPYDHHIEYIRADLAQPKLELTPRISEWLSNKLYSTSRCAHEFAWAGKPLDSTMCDADAACLRRILELAGEKP